ncbi:PhrA family quorum-sensing system peptide [Streptococcus suis]
MKRYKHFSKLFALFAVASVVFSSVNFSPNIGKGGRNPEVRVQQTDKSGGLDVGKAD